MIAYTLDSLRAAIDEWLENDFWGDTDQKDNIISMSEEKIYKTVGIAGFNTKTVALTLSGTPTFPSRIPTPQLTQKNVSESPITPISLRLDADAGGYASFLILKDSNFLQEYLGDTTGVPRFYTFFNSANDSNNPYISIFPKAVSTYSLTFEYFYKPESITEKSGIGTTWLSTYGQEALLYACITNAYTFMKGDADLINLYDTKFKEALQALVFEQGGSFRNPAYNAMDVPNRSMVNQ